MNRIQKLIGLILVGTMFITGCTGVSQNARAINENTDKCAQCNMMVADDSFATQLVTSEGKSYPFDDIGCMEIWVRESNLNANGTKKYVRDSNTGKWLNFDEATYVYDASIRTPMAYGVIAFATVEEAEQFIEKNNVGKMLTSQQLSAHTWMMNEDLMKMHGEAGHVH